LHQAFAGSRIDVQYGDDVVPINEQAEDIPGSSASKGSHCMRRRK